MGPPQPSGGDTVRPRVVSSREGRASAPHTRPASRALAAGFTRPGTPPILWVDSPLAVLRLASLLLASALALGAAYAVRSGEAPVLPSTPYDYDGIALPAHLTAPAVRATDNTPPDNPITDAGATLGRVLFYDPRLSLNGTVSCASCHLQDRGFSDPARFSRGFEGGLTQRHSMGLAFARYYARGHFFWDERAATLEEQVLVPIQDETEMGLPLSEASARIAATEYYPPLFADAFGTEAVTPDRIARALSQFVRSIVPANTRYDDAREAQGGPPGRPLAALTDEENLGLELFFGRGRCAQCHRGDLFVGDVPRNNGLDAKPSDPGAGDGRFKTGSLRNVALTAPYMHDGRFATLEAVIDHYSTGIRDSPTLDPILRGPDGRPLRPAFTPQERTALVAFLRTLTDETLATDPRWSDPFAVTTPAAPRPEPPGLSLTVPTPIRGRATLHVRLPAPGPARLDVFDARGRHIARVMDAEAAMDTRVFWDASGLAGGLYVLRLSTPDAALARLAVVSP
ncbi:MAG TPA: cytochrome-c peroxidase [Bacteroidetes bacterium]|nr:cytochrome-c peroxidase [Bacteroidota bacterium]